MQIFLRIILLSAIIVNITFAKKIQLLYTANVNATYKNCDCGPNPLGGIDRLKTYIDDFRNKNPDALLIDGGNFFNSYPFPELNIKALESLSMLNFNLFSLGFHVFIEEKNIYDNFSKKYYKNIISSNSNLEFQNYKEFLINNTKLRFFGFISPKLFKYTEQPEWLKLKNKLYNVEYLKNGINIFIFNGYLEDAEEFTKNNTEFDLILLSTDQQTGKWKVGNTTIIGGGHDAESIALVEILLNEKGTEFDVKYIDMDSSIKSDESVLVLFENVNTKNNKREL